MGIDPRVVKSSSDIVAIDEVQMRKMDKQSIASLAGKNELHINAHPNECIIGIKDTEILIKYVPSLEKFRLVAHVIRLWAKSKSLILY